MKKIFKMMMAVVAGFAALTACTNEPEEGVTPTPENEYVIVKVGMSDATKGSLTDAEGIKWAVGDQIKYAGGVELTSEALTAEDIEDDGYTANFKFPAALNEVNRTGWFSSTKNHPGNHNEVEFTLGNGSGNMYSQAKAGEMNNRYLFLHSGTGLINITKDETPEVVMDIAGGIFRFMPYTETYNDEAIEYVELAGKNANSIVGTVAYDRGAGTYKGANDINWQNKNFVQVTLDEPFALTNANSRENSKGIYMAIARTTETHPIEGYTITVKTDKATYTFSSDDNLVVGENELRNVYLKLENGSRLGDDDFKGYVYYEGGPGNATINADQTYQNSIGYTVARYSDVTGSTWVYATEGKGQHEWLYNATYKYYDMNGNEVAAEDSWVTMGFSENNICHWCVNTKVNTGAEQRQMRVVGHLIAPEGYKLAVWSDNLNEKEYRYEFIITQKANIVVTGELSNVYADTVPAAGATIEAATLTLNVNDVAATDIAAAMSTYGITVEAGSATATVNANGKITLVVPENPYNEIRTYDLVVKFDGNIVTSTKIYQAAGTEEMPYIYNYTFGAWSGAQGTEVTLNLSANGATNEWLVLLNSVTLKSGENLTLDDIDVNLLVNQVFHSEQAEYDWITYNLDGPINDLRIRFNLAPNTGARRTAVLYAYVSDGSDSWWRKITINQDPAPGM